MSCVYREKTAVRLIKTGTRLFSNIDYSKSNLNSWSLFFISLSLVWFWLFLLGNKHLPLLKQAPDWLQKPLTWRKQADSCSKQVVASFKTDGRLFQSKGAPILKSRTKVSKQVGVFFIEARKRFKRDKPLFLIKCIVQVDFTDHNFEKLLNKGINKDGLLFTIRGCLFRLAETCFNVNRSLNIANRTNQFR